MTTDIHLWYLAHFFSEWEMFQTKVVEKIKTHLLRSITFLRKSCRLWDKVEKYCTAGQATDGNLKRRTHFECWITKATDTHTEHLIFFHGNTGHANAPQYYVVGTFTVFINTTENKLMTSFPIIHR